MADQFCQHLVSWGINHAADVALPPSSHMAMSSMPDREPWPKGKSKVIGTLARGVEVVPMHSRHVSLHLGLEPSIKVIASEN